MHLFDETESTSVLTPLERFYQWERKKPEAIFMTQSAPDGDITYTWNDVGYQVRSMCRALKSLNLQPGACISILSKNCAHWFMADLAIMMSGFVSAPIFTSMNVDSVGYVLTHSETKVLFVGESDNWEAVGRSIPDGIKLISFPNIEIENSKNWDQLVAHHRVVETSPVYPGDQLVSIIYTSGTTGVPKGVMHTVDSFAWAGHIISTDFSSHEKSRFLSYLPLAHAAERIAVFMHSLCCGGHVYFNDTLESFNADLVASNVTWFFAVPRIWEKFQMSVVEAVGADEVTRMLNDPTSHTSIKKNVRAMLGLSQAAYLITGSAPTPLPLHEWYECLDMPLCEIYGMSEALPATANTPGVRKKGTVGKATSHSHVKTSPEGEILIKTKGVMAGYYKSPDETELVVIDGWVHTGDRGEVDEDGFLRITGRTKEIFKTAQGKYVAPSPVEGLFSESKLIDQLCLVGAGLSQAVLLVVLSDEGGGEDRWLLCRKLEVLTAKNNVLLEKHENVGKVVVVDSPWTIKNGLLTHTMKLKRSAIEERYRRVVERVVGETLSELCWFESEELELL